MCHLKTKLLIKGGRLVKEWHSWLVCSVLRRGSIKEEQEDEEICDNYPYESAESMDEHGHSPDTNQDEGNGSPERPNLHFDRVPSLW